MSIGLGYEFDFSVRVFSSRKWLCCAEDEKWDTHRFQKTGKKKHQTKVTTEVVFDRFHIVQSGIQIVKMSVCIVRIGGLRGNKKSRTEQSALDQDSW